jgi:hypothetical protein
MKLWRSGILLFALAILASAQSTAVYPGAIATNTNLLVLNVGHTTLANFVDNSATSLTFTDGGIFTAPTAVLIGNEVIYCSTATGNGLSGCTRGWKGTTAAPHSAATSVTSWYNDTSQAVAEIIALETALGINLANVETTAQAGAALTPTVVVSLPAAASAIVGRPYEWTASLASNFCPDSGAAGVAQGTAVATCVTLDGATWQPMTVNPAATAGSESLSEGNFTAHDKWSTSGDFAWSSGTMVFTKSTGSGQITQTTGNMAVAPVGNVVYKFTYDLTSANPGNLSAFITTGIPLSAPISLALGTGNVVYFVSTGSPGNFVIGGSGSTSGGTFTLDNVSLKQVTNGFAGSVTTAGTKVSAGTCQAQTGISISGVTPSTAVNWSVASALAATWQTGIAVVPVVTAGTVTLNLCNGTAADITPAATVLNVRVVL